MPYQYFEYIPNRIIYFKVTGEFTAQELIESNQNIINHLDAAAPPLHFITDFRAMTSYPMNLKQLVEAFTVFSHPKLGWDIIISTDRVVGFLSLTVIRVVGKTQKDNLKVVKTLDEALEALVVVAPDLEEIIYNQQHLLGQNT